MKIIVMGTGPFAVPTIRWLAESEHEIVAVVTRPVDDPGKRRKTVANPVREFAEAHLGVPILAPDNVNQEDSVADLRSRNADLLFVCDYGQILKRAVLEATLLGGINLHGSLLPAYRGAAPINWAVWHGDIITGVTVIHMTPRLDGGPALAKRKIEIGDQETAEQLEPRMAELGVAAVRESIELLANWDRESPIGEPQDAALVTQAPRLRKQQGNLDWSRTAVELFNQIRAFQPWPGSFTHWLPADGKPLRLIVHRAQVDADGGTAPAGTVQVVDDNGISIATGEGWLRLEEIQPAGKRSMPVAEFLRGRRVAAGDRFGTPDST